MNSDTLLAAIDMCYSALEPNHGLERFTQFLCESLESDAGDIVTEFPRIGTICTHGSVGFDPAFRDSYDEDYLGDNPWLQGLARLPQNRFHCDFDITTAYVNSRYHNEWVRPQGFERSAGAVFELSPDRHTWIGFVRHKDRPAFERQTLGWLDRLLPHIQRVVRIRCQLEVPASEALLAGEALLNHLPGAVFVLDASARVIAQNTHAERCLAPGGPVIRSRDGGLRARTGDDSRRLSQLIRDAGRVTDPGTSDPEIMILTGRNGEAHAVEALPLRSDGPVEGPAAVALTITRPTSNAANVRTAETLFGLSPTEAALARWLAGGGGLAEFAVRRSMATSTARWHLKNLEAKCGTNRIEKLVALLLNSKPPLTPLP